MNRYSWEVSREIAITEVYLDAQARAWEWEHTPASVWASELAKAVVWGIGIGILILLMAFLSPPARGDSFTPTPSGIASYLDSYTPLPLAPGVDQALALNLLAAQRTAWGSAAKSWYPGSLQMSEDSVLKAISLYVWPGGPSWVTDDEQAFLVVWTQSHIAIDPRLSGGFDVTVANFGEAPVVSTPEPRALLLMGFAFLAFALFKQGRRTLGERMVARLRAYRPRPLRP